MKKPTVFISYSTDDQHALHDLVTFMKTLDIELTLDDDIVRPSQPIGETLRQQIQSSHGCVWLLTKNSLASGWCPVEVGAFWGAGKPVIIYNPQDIAFEGPFSGIRQARSLEDIQRAVSDLQARGTALTSLTVNEASTLLKASVKSALQGLTEEVELLREHLPVVRRMSDYLEVQNTFLPDHGAVLSKIAAMLEHHPKRMRCAFDVPSFGSLSAEPEYRMCKDAFDEYVTRQEWSLSLLLLPAVVGERIVETEFEQLERRKRAWVEDIKALRRFEGYAERAQERGRRKFSVNWLNVNTTVTDQPFGLYSMPLNIWLRDDEEAVFSTVIDNYRPVSDSNYGPRVQETGFSTRSPDMIRFISEIFDKYSNNVDKSESLSRQIEIAEKAALKLSELK